MPMLQRDIHVFVGVPLALDNRRYYRSSADFSGAEKGLKYSCNRAGGLYNKGNVGGGEPATSDSDEWSASRKLAQFLCEYNRIDLHPIFGPLVMRISPNDC